MTLSLVVGVSYMAIFGYDVDAQKLVINALKALVLLIIIIATALLFVLIKQFIKKLVDSSKSKNDDKDSSVEK